MSHSARDRMRGIFSNMTSNAGFGDVAEPDADEEVEMVQTSKSVFGSPRPLLSYTRALEQAEFGHFNILLLCTCGGVFFLVQLLPTYLLYAAPYLECDLDFHDDRHRGVLNQLVYVGLPLGAITLGFLADLYRRNAVLLLGLLLQMAGAFAVALTRTFTTLCVSRFLLSFGGAGAVTVAVVVLAEFSLPQHRGAAICTLQMFWILGSVTLPVLGLQWWTAAMLSAVVGVLITLSVLSFPENPRFLLTYGAQESAYTSLRIMYAWNTRNRRSDYPPGEVRDNETLSQLTARLGTDKLIPDYMKPHSGLVLMLVITQFFIMLSYYSVMPYFPDLPQRYDALYSVREYFHPRNVDQCAFGEQKHGIQKHDLALNETVLRSLPKQHEYDCFKDLPQSHTSRDLHQSVLMSFVAIPSVVGLVMGVDLYGRKFFIAAAHIAAAAFLYSGFFLMRTTYDLFFACGFHGVVTLSVAAAQVLVVELASTRSRATAVGLLFAGSYAGQALGNWGLGVAMGLSCSIHLGVLGILVSLTGMVVLVYPDTVGMPLNP